MATVTKYTYSIAEDTKFGKVDTDSLEREIGLNASIIIAISYTETNEDILDIYMKDVLSQNEETALNTTVGNHEGIHNTSNTDSALNIGAYVPDPSGSYNDTEESAVSHLYSDQRGALLIRGQVLTDEDSFRDDFTGDTLNANWIPGVGAGTSYSIASSKLTLVSGTTPGSLLTISRLGDYGPFTSSFNVKLSQRIANQVISFGFSNAPISPTQRACITFDGTDNTKFKFQTQCSDAESEETTVTLPFNLTTEDFITYQIDVGVARCTLAVNGNVLAIHNTHIPLVYTVLNFGMAVINTGVPASSTSVDVDVVQFENHDQLQISNHFIGDPLPVRINEEVHTLSGLLTTTTTTADQIIAQYTIPEGRSFYILGYRLSSSGTSIDGAPFKIRKNSVINEPLAPNGAIDCNIFRSIHISNESTSFEDYSACPRKFAVGGDIVQLTVTPSGITSTKWRAYLDFVLR